jgi:hypothetical protein
MSRKNKKRSRKTKPIRMTEGQCLKFLQKHPEFEDFLPHAALVVHAKGRKFVSPRGKEIIVARMKLGPDSTEMGLAIIEVGPDVPHATVEDNPDQFEKHGIPTH